MDNQLGNDHLRTCLFVTVAEVHQKLIFFHNELSPLGSCSQLVAQLWEVVGCFGGEPQLGEVGHCREELMSYSPDPDDLCFLLPRDMSNPKPHNSCCCEFCQAFPITRDWNIKL